MTGRKSIIQRFRRKLLALHRLLLHRPLQVTRRTRRPVIVVLMIISFRILLVWYKLLPWRASYRSRLFTILVPAFIVLIIFLPRMVVIKYVFLVVRLLLLIFKGFRGLLRRRPLFPRRRKRRTRMVFVVTMRIKLFPRLRGRLFTIGHLLKIIIFSIPLIFLTNLLVLIVLGRRFLSSMLLLMWRVGVHWQSNFRINIRTQIVCILLFILLLLMVRFRCRITLTRSFIFWTVSQLTSSRTRRVRTRLLNTKRGTTLLSLGILIKIRRVIFSNILVVLRETLFGSSFLTLFPRW